MKINPGFDLHLTSPLHVLDRTYCPMQLNLLQCNQRKAGLARQPHLIHIILHLRRREVIYSDALIPDQTKTCKRTELKSPQDLTATTNGKEQVKQEKPCC
jgi:hypothetical protein